MFFLFILFNFQNKTLRLLSFPGHQFEKSGNDNILRGFNLANLPMSRHAVSRPGDGRMDAEIEVVESHVSKWLSHTILLFSTLFFLNLTEKI